MLDFLSTVKIALTLFISLLVILLYSYIHKWTTELEKENCECSNMWQRDFVKYGTIVIIAMSLLALFFNILFRLQFIGRMSLINFLSDYKFSLSIVYFIYVIFGFGYVITLFDYTRTLKNMECVCSESWVREFGYIYSMIMVILSSLSIAILLIFIAIFAFIGTNPISSNLYKSFKV